MPEDKVIALLEEIIARLERIEQRQITVKTEIEESEPGSFGAHEQKK
jgi:hypothetical protein